MTSINKAQRCRECDLVVSQPCGSSYCGVRAAEKVCVSPLATRPILYTDTVSGKQTCRDDLWAVTTDELNGATTQPREQAAIQAAKIALSTCQKGGHTDIDGDYVRTFSFDPAKVAAALAAIEAAQATAPVAAPEAPTDPRLAALDTANQQLEASKQSRIDRAARLGVATPAATVDAQADITTVSTPQYENITDRNGKLVGVRMTNWNERPDYAATTASARDQAKVAQLDADNLPPLESLMTYDPERDAAGLMEWRDKYNDGDYLKVEDVRNWFAPYAERIRHLERELVERKPATSIDAPEFRTLLAAVQGFDDGEPIFGESEKRIIAYIDGRTAGTASEELRKTVNAHCNDLLDCAAILHDDGRFKATAAEIRVAVAELKSALAAAPSTQEGAKP